jgi:hypothetical protein
MTVAISQNIGILAANVSNTSPTGSAAQNASSGQVVDNSQAARISQIAAQEGSVKIELSEKKVIQREKRAEGSFSPKEDEEDDSGSTEESEQTPDKKRAENAYAGMGNRRAPLDLTV